MNRRELVVGAVALAATVTAPFEAIATTETQQWLSAFAAEFARYVDPKSASRQVIEEWARDEAEAHYAAVVGDPEFYDRKHPLELDPALEAAEVIGAIAYMQ